MLICYLINQAVNLRLIGLFLNILQIFKFNYIYVAKSTTTNAIKSYFDIWKSVSRWNLNITLFCLVIGFSLVFLYCLLAFLYEFVAFSTRVSGYLCFAIRRFWYCRWYWCQIVFFWTHFYYSCPYAIILVFSYSLYVL